MSSATMPCATLRIYDRLNLITKSDDIRSGNAFRSTEANFQPDFQSGVQAAIQLR
jgi:hypothetical protein